MVQVGYRTGGRWFDNGLATFFLRGIMIVLSTGFIPNTTDHWFDDGYVGKQLLAFNNTALGTGKTEELQETTGRCTGSPNITEIMLKSIDRSITQSIGR